MANRRRILVIYNPMAGRRRIHRLSEVLSALEDLGCEPMVRLTTGRGAARAFAAAATPEQFDVVVAAGGDGTINEVANGLVGTGVPMGVIPLGTANVLALEMGLPSSAEGIAEVIADGPARTIHLGRVDGRYFLIMAGVGFDAVVVANVHSRLKRLMGKAAFVWETLKTLIRYPLKPYKIRVDGQAYRAESVVLANGRYYGGSFTCAPEARLTDPNLQVCLFLGGGRLNAARYALALTQGRLAQLPDVKVIPARSIVIEGREGDPVQGDGEIIARTPLTVELADETLDLVMPG